MKFRSVAASVVAGTATVLLVGGVALPAHADVTVSAVGWWTSSVTPPTVPDGGVAVSNDPSGVSVAALKLDIGGGASSATLKLVEAPNQIDKLATMQVCAAADTWSPASGGAAAQAPADTCSAGSVLLAQQGDGSWTADIHQLIAGKTESASVIVKPAANAAPFQVAFERPTVDGVTTDSSSSESTSSSGSTATSPSSDTSSSPSSSSSPSFSGTNSSSSFSAAPSFSAPVAASPAPEVASAPAASATPAPAPAASSTPAASDSTSAGSGQFKANLSGGTSAAHRRATKGTALGVFALAVAIGAAAAGASWAKAQGLFDMTGLRERLRFSR